VKIQEGSKQKINLPDWMFPILSPVFQEMCVHGETQNDNESINNVIWTRCP